MGENGWLVGKARSGGGLFSSSLVDGRMRRGPSEATDGPVHPEASPARIEREKRS